LISACSFGCGTEREGVKVADLTKGGRLGRGDPPPVALRVACTIRGSTSGVNA
jgi:hypothetical protein